MPKISNPNYTQPDPLRETRARLSAALALLTQKQRGGIDQIIAAEMQGNSIDSLIAGKVFAHGTYYGKAGWLHNPQFQAALNLAREVSFDARLSASVRRARETIVLSSPDAAAALVAALVSEKAEVVLRAAESILNRADRSVADRSGQAAIVVTGDDLIAAREEVAAWEAERFNPRGQNAISE